MKPLAERCDSRVRVAGAPAPGGRANRPPRKGLTRWTALARAMLRRGAAGLIVRSLASGLIVYCVGCVIPTPLEAEPAQPAGRPVIVDAQPRANQTDPFGFVTYGVNDEFGFSITAVDDNLTDQLYAKIYRVDGETYTPITSLVQMMQDRPTTEPSRRVANFETTQYCCGIAGTCGMSITDERVAVLVAKGSIPAGMGGKKPALDADSYDEKYWVMTCH